MVQIGLVHRVAIHTFAVDLVADADVYLVDRGENIEERDGDVGYPVERRGPFDGREIQPPHPPAPARGRTVLSPHAPYDLARLVEELRGHRPVADPRRVSLGDADDVLEVPRGDAGTDDRAADRRVGRGDKGIGPVVVVQERRLSPFEQHALPVLQRLPEERPRVGDHRPDKLPEREQPGGDVGDLVVLLAVDVLEDRVLLPEGRLELGLQDALVEDVLDANAGAGDLVLVGRAYTLVGRPDPGITESDLAMRVERDVVGHDQVRPSIDFEPISYLEVPLFEGLDLLEQHLGVDHDPVADGADHALAHDPRWHQVKLELLLTDTYCVAGVVAARVARDVVHVGGERVAHPALALISPGQSEDDRGRQSCTSAVW